MKTKYIFVPFIGLLVSDRYAGTCQMMSIKVAVSHGQINRINGSTLHDSGFLTFSNRSKCSAIIFQKAGPDVME